MPHEVMLGELPAGLSAVCFALLGIAVLSSGSLVVDVARHPPQMTVMRIVWPVTGLYGSVFAIALRRLSARDPRRWSTAVATTHCGAGCSIGDLIAEWLLFALPGVAVVAGWRWLFPDRMPAVWVIDTVLAAVLGVLFQYASIAPARGLSLRAGLAAAAKADLASIAAWQLGMIGTMALVQWLAAPAWFGARLSVATPEFWVAMQVAMGVGFAVAFPVNALLIRSGIKEAMA